MKSLLYNRLLIATVALFISAAFGIVSEWIVFEKNLEKTFGFLLAVLIVLSIVYWLMASLSRSYPGFLEKGRWGYTPFLFFLSMGAIVFLTICYIGLFEFLQLSPFLQRMTTVLLAYLVVFALVISVYSFVRNLLNLEKRQLILVSTFSVFLILELITLSSI